MTDKKQNDEVIMRARRMTALVLINAEAQGLATSRKIQTEEGRALVVLVQRLIESLIDGEPKTQPRDTHHA